MRARDDYPLFGALRDAYIDGHTDTIGREASRVLRELDDLRDRLAATDISPWSFIADGDLDYANGEAHDYAVDCGTAHWCAGCLSMPASYWTRDTNAGNWPHIHSAPNGLQLHIRRIDGTFNVIRRPFCPRRYTEPRPVMADHPFEHQVGSNMCVCGEPDTSHSPTLRLIENYAPSPVRFQAVCTRCGWHWPQQGYVTQETARSVYGQHDCAMHAHSDTWSAESLLNRRRRKDLARIHRPAIDEGGTCTICGVPDVHCQCPDVDSNEGLWQADDVADSYEDDDL